VALVVVTGSDATLFNFAESDKRLYFVISTLYPPNKFLSRFKVFFGFGVLNLGFLVGIRIYRLLQVGQSVSNRVSVWDKPGYYPVYIIQRLVSIAYYYVIIQTSSQLCDEAHYRVSAQTLQQLIAKHGGM